MKKFRKTISRFIIAMSVAVSLVVPGITVSASGPGDWEVKGSGLVHSGGNLYFFDGNADGNLVQTSVAGTVPKKAGYGQFPSGLFEHDGKMYYTSNNSWKDSKYLKCYDTEYNESYTITDDLDGKLVGVTNYGCVIEDYGNNYCYYDNYGFINEMKGTKGLTYMASNDRFAFFGKAVSSAEINDGSGNYKTTIRIYRYSLATNQLAKIKTVSLTRPYKFTDFDLLGYVYSNNRIAFCVSGPGDRLGSVYFMKADGTGITKLNERSIRNPVACNNSVYFKLENNKLLKVNKDGSSKTLSVKADYALVAQNSKNEYIVIKNNYKADADLYAVKSLTGDPVRTLFDLSDSMIPGKVSSKILSVIGNYGDIVCIKAEIFTDSHVVQGVYTINSRTAKKTLISCEIGLSR